MSKNDEKERQVKAGEPMVAVLLYLPNRDEPVAIMEVEDRQDVIDRTNDLIREKQCKGIARVVRIGREYYESLETATWPSRRAKVTLPDGTERIGGAF